MDEVWMGVVQFINSLNRENRKRDYYITTPEVQKAEKTLIDKEEKWEKWLVTLSEEDKKIAEEMKDCIEEYSSAQESRAYLQGYIDCIQVLTHIGILKEDIELKKILTQFTH